MTNDDPYKDLAYKSVVPPVGGRWTSTPKFGLAEMREAFETIFNAPAAPGTAHPTLFPHSVRPDYSRL